MSLDRMEARFRPADTLLSCVLGVLSWCDALARALTPVEVSSSDRQTITEQQLIAPDAGDDATHFLLGLLAFERSFRTALERASAQREPLAAATASVDLSSDHEPLGR